MKDPMKRRKEDWDYSQPRIYMITIAVEGRRALFGRIAGMVEAPRGSADAPRVELTPLGRCVNAEVERIPRHYPQVRILAKQVMPDHVHFILQVTAPLPCHLGRVINGYKVGCNRSYRHLLAPATPPASSSAAPASAPPGAALASASLGAALASASPGAAPPPASPQSGSQRDTPPGCDSPSGVSFRAAVPRGSSSAALPPPAASSPAPRAASCPPPPAPPPSASSSSPPASPGSGLLWERGYHDRLLAGPGQLKAMIDYIRDNPRRLLLRRCRPEWLRPRFGVHLGSQTYSLIGNLGLLLSERKVVRVSRRCNDAQVAEDVARYMAAARSATVLISPSISPGEKQTMRTAFDAHLPLVVLVENGFTPYSKPSGEQYDACAEGRLLLLAPWPHHNDRRRITAQQCQQLNLMALELEALPKEAVLPYLGNDAAPPNTSA